VYFTLFSYPDISVSGVHEDVLSDTVLVLSFALCRRKDKFVISCPN
jgi:hypothetical protein